MTERQLGVPERHLGVTERQDRQVGMTERQWRRRMGILGILMVPGGALLMGIGATLAVGADGLTGYVVGAAGVTLLVLGALFGKFAAWGPVPDSVRGVR